MNKFISLLLCLATCFSLIAQAPPSISKIKLGGWQKERLAPGLKWKQLTRDDLFGTNQNLNVLEIDLRKRKLVLAYESTLRKPTSEFARKNEALAAVNAGFFDMKRGGSVTYLKVAGKLINQTPPEVKVRGSVALKGVFVIEKDEDLRIESSENEAFLRDSSIHDALVTGPFLLDDGLVIPLDSIAFNNNRHPRTCACLTKKGKLLLLTVDGRNEQARGMSLPELTQVLQKLNCWDAVNFDGGGSTTMYIKDKGPNGVVNRPSDNKKFDPYGERKVANALLIF